jgi:hypothetical protein
MVAWFWPAIQAGIAAWGTYEGTKAAKKSDTDDISATADPLVYQNISTGLSGGGLTSAISNKGVASTIRERDEAFAAIRSSLGLGGPGRAITQDYVPPPPGSERQSRLAGAMRRAIHPEDATLWGFVARSAAAQKARGDMQVYRDKEMQDFADIPTARGMALGALSTEMGVGSQLSSIANESALRQAQMPTFGTEFGYGAGAATGTLLAGRQPGVNYADAFSRSYRA